MSNEVISFIKIVKSSIPAKPRSPFKIKRWTMQTLTMYKLCLEAGTKWETIEHLLNTNFANSEIKYMYDAYISIGGFDSGLDISGAKLRQLGKGATRYENGKSIPLEGMWYVMGTIGHNGVFGTKEEAIESLKAYAGTKAKEASAKKTKTRVVKFSVYRRRADGCSQPYEWLFYR